LRGTQHPGLESIFSAFLYVVVFFVFFLFTCRIQGDTTLSHPGCDNTQQGVAQMCHDGLDLNQR
ncbi:hypothetical protein O5824_26645, partial [Escherichia coli]|nr:hypothetical protein [Escherichia coli]